MDSKKTGGLIRALRLSQGKTQLALAEEIGVSDKAVSKWERGWGGPDLSLLPEVAQALGVSTEVLLRGELGENAPATGNLRRSRFYVCPLCGNLALSTDPGEVRCCGRALAPLAVQTPDEAHSLSVAENDGEWYLTSEHEMLQDHAISFVALVSGETLILKKLYPEWAMETRLPLMRRGTLLWYCTRDGLFGMNLLKK